MSKNEMLFSRCPQTGAMVFNLPAHVVKQQEEVSALKAENQALKDMMQALIAAQPDSVKKRLPESLRGGS